MIVNDFHTHTVFSDGKNTPEEMVLSAIEKGMKRIGISDHSYTSFDDRFCLQRDEEANYKKCIADLKEKYAVKIEVLCGLEQDFYSDWPAKGYDYVIGSVHYMKHGDVIIPVDEDPAMLREAAEKYFDGDIYCIAELYYSTVAQVAEKTGADIIGHFDLITKFIEIGIGIDEKEPRYIRAWQAAADRLLKAGKYFEINTGAMSRGYRTSPYPSSDILEYLRERGAKFILSSDSHAKNTLRHEFDNYEKLL